MARKTLIRTERPHEVKLAEGQQLAQSQKLDVQEVPQPPASIRKPAAQGSSEKSDQATAASPAVTPARKKPTVARSTPAPAPATAARKRTGRTSPSPAQPAPPKLPARVPADRLWEDDSAVMQRLHALVQQNARLAEQLQRIQHPAPPKGFQP